MKCVYTLLMLLPLFISGQQENAFVREGNKLYKKGEFAAAHREFQRAVEQNPSNAVASYNLGNAYFKDGKYDQALESFDRAIKHSDNISLRQQAYYNKGVSFTRLDKLEESIIAYKEALKLNPNDDDARHNLQKALLELKKKQPPPPPNKQQKKQQQQPQKKQQSKLNKKQVDQYLKALRQKELEVQQKMQQNKKKTTAQPEKDW